jgi:hypothetical protein
VALSKSDLDEIKTIVKDGQTGTVNAVRDMFISVGININDPIKVQSQMNFLAKATKMADKIVSKVVLTAVALFGAIAIGWAAIGKMKG